MYQISSHGVALLMLAVSDYEYVSKNRARRETVDDCSRNYNRMRRLWHSTNPSCANHGRSNFRAAYWGCDRDISGG